MKHFLGTVQKRIGLLISILDLFVVVTNFINYAIIDGIVASLLNISVWFMFLIIIPFVFSIFIESRVLKILQVLAILFVGTISVIQDYEGFYGPALFLASWLMMRQYGYLEKHGKKKNIGLLVAVVVLSQISANLHTHEGAFAGFSTLWFSLFLSTLVLIIWRDMINQQKELKKENNSLQINYKKLAVLLEEIEKNKQPYNLKACGVSPAEERVIKILTIYKASNREIAERLDLAESTVKLHLYNIFNKIGVDNRFAVIDLCKYNFN